MTVRPLGPEDAPAWHALMLEATERHAAAFLRAHAEIAAMTPEQIAATLGRGHLHGLFDGGRLIGVAGLNRPTLDRLSHRAEIGPFYVDDAARGTGAADRLLEHFVARARASSVDWLDLWVAACNGRARAFYARHGFREVARREDAVRLGETSMDDVLMTRCLAAAEGLAPGGAAR